MPDTEGGKPSPKLLGLDEDDVFLKLSALITGVGDLDPLLGKDYRDRLEASYGAAIDRLCELFYDIIGRSDPAVALSAAVAGDTALSAAVRQIASIWYLSQFYPDPAVQKPELAGHFERGLLWRIIDAHPPAFSQRPHGYWAAAPEEL